MTQLSQRMKRIEAKAHDANKSMAVLTHYPDETEDEALARHYRKHPDDRDAKTTVIIRNFSGSFTEAMGV